MAAYTAVRDLIVGGDRVKAGKTFTAEPEAVAGALAQGWAKPGGEPKPKSRTKPKAKR